MFRNSGKWKQGIICKGLFPNRSIMKRSSPKTFATAFCTGALIAGIYLAAPAGSRAQIFTQITTADIVSDKGIWICCLWGDFGNTGFLDLIAPNYQPGTNGFYQNEEGTFLKTSQGDPVEDSDYHIAA
jgi:hypothetical protein